MRSGPGGELVLPLLVHIRWIEMEADGLAQRHNAETRGDQLGAKVGVLGSPADPAEVRIETAHLDSGVAGNTHQRGHHHARQVPVVVATAEPEVTKIPSVVEWPAVQRLVQD